VGVFRGGTALLLSALKSDGISLHLFDTFDGMPDVDQGKNFHKKEDFSNTYITKVQNLIGKFPNHHIHPGIFPATASSVENQQFSLCHIDVDIYSSVLDSCQFFYPRLVSGGVLIFDDYGFTSCPGAKQAVREFSDSLNIREVHLPTGQSIILKQ
jgi:O-methyltransferase